MGVVHAALGEEYERQKDGKQCPIVFLNDDVRVSQRLQESCQALLDTFPEEDLFSLAVKSVAHEACHEGYTVRRWHVTGEGYIIRDITKILSWIQTVPAWFVKSVNDDVLLTYYAWEQRRPIIQCIPSLVDHDIEARSMYGHDKQSIEWRKTFAFNAKGCTVWDPRRDTPVLVNPWLSENSLREFWERINRWRSTVVPQDTCVFCLQNPGDFTSHISGAQLCATCKEKMI